MSDNNPISLDNIIDQEETEKLITDNHKKSSNENYLNSNYKTKKKNE